MLDIILNGLTTAFQLDNLFYMTIGVSLGIIFGALPGLTATMGIAVLLPVTFGMEPASGILFLLGIYCGGVYGASIPAILISTPGSPASAAIIEEGRMLVKQNRIKDGLIATVFASAWGGIISALILLFVAPQLAKFALKFGPAEYFAMALFGLTMITGLSSKSIVKGMIMGLFGFLASTVGMDPITGSARFTFGNINFLGGLQLVPIMVGLFAITEVLSRSETAHLRIKKINTKVIEASVSVKKYFKYWKTIIKSSLIGTFVGMIPGTGAPLASFLSYNEAKRSSKNKEEYGKGSIEGVIAAESGNNGVTGATLIPLLTLGIPGDAVTAILLGGLIVQGMAPGPQLFVEQADVMYTIMLGLLLINIIMFIQGRLAMRLFAKVIAVPMNILIPILITLCFVGAFAVNNTIFDAKVMLAFGVFGFLMSKLDFPIIPMLLGVVLGPIAEPNFRRALVGSNGDWMVFLTKPISLFFLILAFVVLFMPVFKYIFKKRKKYA